MVSAYNDYHEIPIRLSCGFALIGTEKRDVDALYKEADRNMYRENRKQRIKGKGSDLSGLLQKKLDPSPQGGLILLLTGKEEPPVYKIGEFSKITSLTIKALRYYEEQGFCAHRSGIRTATGCITIRIMKGRG